MDDAVVRALAKWPDVPDVFGWLRLDKRGQWRLKDEIVRHAGLIAFLGRNYESDTGGRWFVQNGPQRVYVALDYTPWVIRIGAEMQLETHTGLTLNKLIAAMLDDEGRLLIESEHGIGVVTDRDLPTLLDLVLNDAGQIASETELLAKMRGDSGTLVLRWTTNSLSLAAIHANDVPARYSYMTNPAPTESALSV